eukprot:5315117-Alexandrium_andersonii.AAC.1
MTAPTAVAAANGQGGPPLAPRMSPTATGSHRGAQPQPCTAVLKAARRLRSAMLGGEAIWAACGTQATTK